MNDPKAQLAKILSEPQVRACVVHVTALCTGSSPVAFWASVYLMRLVCRKYAYTFLQLLLGTRAFAFLAARVDSTKQAAARSQAPNVREQLRPDAFLLYGAEYAALRTTWSDLLYRAGDATRSGSGSNDAQVALFASALKDAIGRVAQPELRPLLALLSLGRTLLADDRGVATFEQLVTSGDQQIVQSLAAAFEGISPLNLITPTLQKLLPRGSLPTFAQVCLIKHRTVLITCVKSVFMVTPTGGNHKHRVCTLFL